MENRRRRRKESSIYWLLVLGVFVLGELQAEANKTSQVNKTSHVDKNQDEPKILQGHHRHEALFTAVGTRHSLFNFTVIHVIDDILVFYFDKQNQQIVFREEWITKVLGKAYIEYKKKIMLNSQRDFTWLLKILLKNDTKNDKNHTLQLFAECELDDDIEISKHLQFAIDGEDFLKIDDLTNHWIAMKSEAEYFKPLAENYIGTKFREKAMKEFCFDMMRKVLQYSNMKENVAPEVTVSRHDAPDGRVTFNCIATGFYPHAILLRWEKDGQPGVWGRESSSGTLPNADSTFYLRNTLELPPGDSETGYTCVVEHTKLKTPVVYPVPEKPTVKRPWVMTLGILTAIILVLSCAGAFSIWKKKKTGHRTQEHATVDGEGTL